MGFKRKHRILSSGKSPSFIAMNRTRLRAILNGGVTQDFSANVENIREISRKLGYNILSDAAFVYVPSSYGEGKNFAQVQNKRNLLQWSEDISNVIWVSNAPSVTRVSNTIVAPNGTLTADKITENTLSSPQVIQQSSIPYVSNSIVTYSIFLKAAERGFATIGFFNQPTTNGLYANVNLTTGVFSTSIQTLGTVANVSSSIVDAGNGWWRCSLTASFVGTNINYQFNINASNTFGNYAGTAGNGIYIWGAQLETGAYATPYQKTVAAGDGIVDFNFTRATSSTVTNKQGVIEDSCYNLLQRSEEFENNSFWIKANSGISANNTIAPNGTLTSDKLIENASNTAHTMVYVQPNGIQKNNVTYTFSCYMKAAGRNWGFLFAFDGVSGANNKNTYFDLINGVVGSSLNGAVPTIIDAGNGWWRCSITYSFSTIISLTDSGNFGVLPATANNVNSYLGNNFDGIYIWGAQLVQGSTPRPYLRTTNRLNVPKLDYSRSLLEPSLLIERQSTNLALRSEEFNTTWSTNGVTVVVNSDNAPNNTLTADSLRESSTATTDRQIYQAFSSTSGQTYTGSVYIKKYTGAVNTRRYAHLVLNANAFAGNRWGINVDLQTGLVTSSNNEAGATPITNNTYRVYDTNGYWRVVIIGTINLTTTSYFTFGISNTATPTWGSGNLITYTGDGVSTITAWGAQLEVGSNATTYIPTTTATVTRNAETSYVDLFNNAVLSQNNFTLFVEGYLLDGAGTNLSVGLSDTTATGARANDIGFFDGIKATRTSSSVITSDTLSSEANTPYSFAVQRNGTTVNFFKNGVLQFTQTVPVVDYRYLVVNNGGSTFTIDKISLFNRTLTNTECSNLTMLGGLNKNLVAYYKLNSSTTDSLGLSPTGTAIGVDYVAGKTGNAARFDAATDRIDIVDTTNMSFTDGTIDIPFSISLWVYFVGFNSIGNWLINKRNAVSGGDEWQIEYYQNRIQFNKFDKANNTILQSVGTPTSSLSLNTWYNITVTDDGSKTVGGINIYINSTPQTLTNLSSGIYSGMNNGTAITRIGLNAWDLTTPTTAHQGYIEDVGIWKNRVLTQQDIDYLYNSGNGRTYPL